MQLESLKKAQFAASAAASDAGSRSQGALARAGPCADWKLLEVLKTLDESGQQIKQCKSKAEIESVFEKSKAPRTVLAALCTSCKASVQDLKGARLAKRKADERKEKEEAKKIRSAKKGGGAAGGSTKPGLARKLILSELSAQSAYIQARQVPALQDLAGSLPLVVAKQQKLVDWTRSTQQVKREIDDFATQFTASARRLTQGRGQRPCLDQGLADEIVTMVTNELSEVDMVAPDSHLLSDSSEALKKTLFPCFYAQTSGAEAVPALEKKMLPTLRIALRGMRAVTVVRSWEVTKYLQEKSNSDKQVRSVDERLETASAAEIETFHHVGNTVWKVTLSQGDVLYTPAGYMVGQRVGNSEDHIGLRVGVFPRPQYLLEAIKCGESMAETGVLESLKELHGLAEKWFGQRLVQAQPAAQDGSPDPQLAGQQVRGD